MKEISCASKTHLEKEITWNVSSLSRINHHTNQCELEV